MIPQVKRKKLLMDLAKMGAISTESPISVTLQLEDRMKKMFRAHIGKGNAVSPVEIFETITHLDIDSVDYFKKAYLWDLLKRVMRGLREKELVFITHSGNDYFVLQTQDELKLYKKMMNMSISNIKKNMVKAEAWVNNQKWRALQEQ